MSTIDNTEMMNNSPFRLATVEELRKLKKNTLLGFKAFENTVKISAAYPLYLVYGNSVDFVLCEASDNGRQILDGTHITSPIYINEPPIVIEREEKPTMSCVDRVTELFGGK